MFDISTEDGLISANKDPSETFYKKLKPGAIPSLGLPVNDKVLQKVKAEVEIWKETEMKTDSRYARMIYIINHHFMILRLTRGGVFYL